MTAKSDPSHWKSHSICQHDIADFDEVYRPIENTGGDYRINRNGVVISRKRKELSPGWWIVLKQSKSRIEHPYNRVAIHRDHKISTCQVSVLILTTFGGPKPSQYHVAAHKNGISDDDRLDNLVWAEPKDVKKSSIVRGTWASGERVATCKHDMEQVQAARNIVINHGVSTTLLASALGMNETRVREWIIGDSWNDAKWEGIVCPLTGNVKE